MMLWEAIGSGIIKTGEGGKVATAEVQKFADTAAKLAVAIRRVLAKPVRVSGLY